MYAVGIFARIDSFSLSSSKRRYKILQLNLIAECSFIQILAVKLKNISTQIFLNLTNKQSLQKLHVYIYNIIVSI